VQQIKQCSFVGVGSSRVVGIVWLRWSNFVARALPLSVIIMVWSGKQRGFAVRTFFENGRSLSSQLSELSGYNDIMRSKTSGIAFANVSLLSAIIFLM